jgi:hypothetical protein
MCGKSFREGARPYAESGGNPPGTAAQPPVSGLYLYTVSGRRQASPAFHSSRRTGAPLHDFRGVLTGVPVYEGKGGRPLMRQQKRMEDEPLR